MLPNVMFPNTFVDGGWGGCVVVVGGAKDGVLVPKVAGGVNDGKVV